MLAIARIPTLAQSEFHDIIDHKVVGTKVTFENSVGP